MQGLSEMRVKWSIKMKIERYILFGFNTIVEDNLQKQQTVSLQVSVIELSNNVHKMF
jgi:hypothetical protein